MALSVSKCLFWRSTSDFSCKSSSRLQKLALLLAAIFWAFVCEISPCLAQVANVTDVEATPMPGAGHDYLHMLDETVNPSNGSLSVRIQVPVPKGRGLTLPFAFAYDSNGAINSFQAWNNPLYQLGWSYSVPMLSTSQFSDTGSQGPCSFTSAFVFYDAQGSRHGLDSDGGLVVPFGGNCQFTISRTGGDPVVSAWINTSNQTVVQDPDGTTYTFPGWGGFNFPTAVEDRNGNLIQYVNNGNGAFTETDTAGRTVISSNGFGATGDTLTVSGLSSPYILTWGTTDAWNYNREIVGPVYVPSGATCEPANSQFFTPPSSSGYPPSLLSVLSALTLPNGQSYHFYYDPTYGVINKIVYPSGAWVEYTWGLNPKSEMYAGPAAFDDGQSTFCDYLFANPVITERQVSYDGTSVAEVQTFPISQYGTTWGTSGPSAAQWTGKTTTVTTTDNVRGQSFNTVYTYGPVVTPAAPQVLGGFGTQVPVENQIVYYNWDGSVLETVNKVWQNQYLMPSQQTLLQGNGPASLITFAYGNLGVEINMSEYDYGQTQSPTRQTVSMYQAFPDNPLNSHIYDRPCKVLVEDGSNNRISETDYLYDGGTTVCGTAGTPSVTGVSNITGHDESHYGPSSTAPRGNVTQRTQWASTGSSPTTTYTYDEAGKVLSVTDPCGNGSCSDMTGSTHTTHYSFVDKYSSGTPPGATDTYVTTITNALGQYSTFGYGYADGQLTSITDPNSQVTTYQYGIKPSGCSYTDLFDRLGQTNYPDGGVTTICYNDSPYNPSTLSPSVSTSQLISGSLYKTSTTAYDGIGHAIETILSSDPDGTTYTSASFDGEGKPYQVSNPYRTTNDPTYGITTYTYDAIGRTTKVSEPDGSAVSTSYLDSAESNASGYFTLVTDEAGNQRLSRTDGLGRLTNLWEAPYTSGYNYPTNYAYDLLDDLTSVAQNGSNSAYARNRSFVYDSLARLTSAANPESGTITYGYDLNRNLSNRVAPLPDVPAGNGTVTTNYQYDAVNRLVSKGYSGMTMPTILFGYDGVQPQNCSPPHLTDQYPVGRRTAMCDGSGSTSWAHDNLGRSTAQSQLQTTSSTTSQTFTIIYLYNYDGSVKTINYPSTNSIGYSVGGAGRPTQASDSGNSYVRYAQSLGAPEYTPNGALANALNGYTSSFPGIVVANSYNKRLQPAILSAATSAQTIFSLGYGYNPGVDNGNVLQITNGVRDDATANVYFAYDPLNRLSQANTATGLNCWGEAYNVDAWGNLVAISGVQSMSGCNSETAMDSVGVSNQITGFCYDGAGNLLDEGACAVQYHSFVYDAEGQLQSPPAVGVGNSAFAYTYYYDGDGNRTQKCDANPCTSASTAGTLYWRGIGGEVLDESDRSGNMLEEYVYFNGERIARRDLPSGDVHYYFSNHLGSASVITDSSGNVQEQMDYYPFGGIALASGGDENRYKFTGKERDSESGLDNFGKRYFASTMGRWMSPDLVNITEDRVVNPANTLNKYVYGGNNPLKYVDPDGQDITYFYDPGIPAGHAVLYAYNQASGDFAIESFGPKVSFPVWAGESNFDMGEFSSAQGLRDNYASLTIQTTPELAQQVIDYIRANPDPSVWSFTGPNCSSEVAKILKQFKLDNQSKWDLRQGLTPKILWHSLMSRYNPSQNHWGSTPNRGQDYGSPQFDMFNLLWFSLPQAEPKATVTTTSTNCVTDQNGKKTCDTQ